jgi:zinc transporter ZupT
MHAVLAAFLGGCLAWAMTALGAALVFVFPTGRRFKPLQQRMLDTSMGFAGGVMTAASAFSLLIPSIRIADGSVIPAAVGCVVGGLFVFGSDRFGPGDNQLSVYLAPDAKKDDEVDLGAGAALHGVQDSGGVRRRRAADRSGSGDDDDAVRSDAVDHEEARRQRRRIFNLLTAIFVHKCVVVCVCVPLTRSSVVWHSLRACRVSWSCRGCCRFM